MSLSLTDIMIDQLGAARSNIENGQQVVPAWVMITPEGPYLVLTRFDDDNPEQRERALLLISRFMTWKLATSFVLSAQTRLGAEDSGGEAILVVGVSRHERVGLLQRIRRRQPPSLTSPEWLSSEQVDEAYSGLFPSKVSEMTTDEVITERWRRSG
jgi:hypothetical protein